MKIGYARISTVEQNLDLQRDALQKAGCETIVVDKASGTVAARPGLEKAKELLRAGDTLVVCGSTGSAARCKISLLGRSISKSTGSRWRASRSGSTPRPRRAGSRFICSVRSPSSSAISFGSEHKPASQLRGLAGALAAVRARSTRTSKQLRCSFTENVAKICAMMGISKPTLYAYVRAAGDS